MVPVTTASSIDGTGSLGAVAAIAAVAAVTAAATVPAGQVNHGARISECTTCTDAALPVAQRPIPAGDNAAHNAR